MNQLQIENIELDILITAINDRYGYDFSNYSRASLKRRIIAFISKSEQNHISELIPLLLYDKVLFNKLLFSISVTVTEMFRDPQVYKALRHHLVPYLKTFPYAKVWCAGCATGEEVYSLAILFKEAGLAKRVQIYATDINADSLEVARSGIFPARNFKDYTSNYMEAGGCGTFSDYYHSRYDSVIIDPSLRENIVFANHNLVCDASFGEMQLIICRNTLIYFNKELQDRVLKLFSDSLGTKGFLCLGTKEDLKFTSVAKEFKTIDASCKIFQLLR